MNYKNIILLSIFLFKISNSIRYENKLKHHNFLLSTNVSRILSFIKLISFISIINNKSEKKILKYIFAQCILSKLINITNTRTIIILLSALFFTTSIFAGGKKLSLPRFASVKANEVNARNGPAIKSPIEWIFVKKGEPIEIIDEYEQWRKIRDVHGEGGWVHASVLSGKRYVIVNSREIIFLYKNPQNNSDRVAKIYPEVRCQLIKCKEKWCKVQCNSCNGWIAKKQIWGVYEHEFM